MNKSEGNNGPAISPGHLIGGGHYSLHVPLGDEGLLWLAQDEQAQRLAAIRFLPPEIRRDERSLRVLKARVEAAQGVQQENLCRILEWYESSGVETFIATEYIEGKGVLEAMNGGKAGPIPWSTLAPVAASVACALLELHRHGVVHHAVSPENVLIASDKRVKLLNTVVAGVIRNPLLRPAALEKPLALRCFSPQQLNGEEPVIADDFYALGATLFELLTGTPVFADSDSLLQDVQSKPADSVRDRLRSHHLNCEVPSEVDHFISACLSKNPAERPTSLDVLLPPTEAAIPALPRFDATVPLEENRFSAAVPVRSELQVVAAARPVRRHSPPLAWAAILLLLACVAGAALFVAQRKSSERQAAAAAAKAAEQEKQEAEAKLAAEMAARREADEDARQAQLQLAQVSEEKRRIEAEAKLSRTLPDVAREEIASVPKKPGVPPKPSTSTNGFVSLFNGTDLTGWSGDTNYWSVKDGYLTAQSRSDAPKQRHLLVSQKGTVSDFELHFSYRFRLLRGNRQPNGGVNYRLTGETNLTCYQYDLVTSVRDVGSVTDDRKRARLAGYGESVIATASGSNKVELVAQIGDTNKLSAIRPEDWHKCVIIAKGNRVTHYLDGIMVADVVDEHKRRHTQGLIALELYTRNTNNCATFLQFSDVKFKKLSSSGASLANAVR